MEQEALFAHALNLIAEFSPRRLSELHVFFGTYEAAWNASMSDFARALKEDSASTETTYKKRRTIQVDKELKNLHDLHITPLLLDDTRYPSQLRHIPSPPALLYIQGLIPSFTTPALAVVGTRMPTAYGREACRALVSPLAAAGIPIISGLASGIDTEAHKCSIAQQGYTVAVLGSGISRNVLYPSSNRRLADEIIASGGTIVSEYPPLLGAAQWTFPQRNRIIAGLSSAVLVIEARRKSGTRITASFALEFGRDVYAVPGPIFSATSETPHALIRDGAVPITSADDLFEALGVLPAPQTKERAANVSEEEHAYITLLAEPLSVNDIARTLKKNVGDIQRTLALLEIRGMVRNMGNGLYRNI